MPVMRTIERTFLSKIFLPHTQHQSLQTSLQLTALRVASLSQTYTPLPQYNARHSSHVYLATRSAERSDAMRF